MTVSLNATQATNTVVASAVPARRYRGCPATATVPAGQVSAAFNVAANTAGQADITATLNGTSATSHVDGHPGLAHGGLAHAAGEPAHAGPRRH